MAVHFHKSSPFEEVRLRIEQHLFESVLDLEKNIELAIRSVELFAESIERLMDTLEQMYQTPGPQDTVGEKSFPIREGRYRVFFKISVRPNLDLDITFLDIDDNRQSNLDRFPSHHLTTFENEG
jgi:hypothetical protein